MQDCDFIHNVGGAVFVEGGSEPTYTFERCRFIDNSAVREGSGALYLGGGCRDCFVRDCLFIGNGSFEGGGAAYVQAANFERCRFFQNFATRGGAVEFKEGRIVDCVFDSNAASERGGAIYAENNEPVTIENCVFVNNYAGLRGGGLTVFARPLELKSSVVWQNRDQFGGERAQLDVCCDYDVRYNCIQDWSGALGGVGNFDADPMFVDGENGDFHLAAGSPCIGTGDPFEQGIGRTDFDGEPRVMGGRVDIGADEFTDRPFLFGDANCDGVRDNGDIDSFVLALLDADAWLAANPGCLIGNADANGDGTVDNGDIDWFVAYLLGP